MKRSEINAIMRSADAFIRQRGFLLPPFAYWTPAEWAAKGNEVAQIVDANLGWDITDFGLGDFAAKGLFLFTVRNGSLANLNRGRGKVYAEKLMVVEANQLTPLHFHWIKTEDIINRGGGNLIIQLYNATEDEGLADSDVIVFMDGIQHTVTAGSKVTLTPGESITLEPYCYHAFWAEDRSVLIGEVSTVNDDKSDNCFYSEIGRFPAIEEDDPPLYLLVGDYAKYVQV